MKRVVIDTNVLVAAGFNRQSAAARLVAGLRDGHLQLVWDRQTRAEAEAILRRIPGLDWHSCAALFRPEGEFADSTDPVAFAVIPDRSDRKFAALSAAAKAPLVTNDGDLLTHRRVAGIDALTPREFLERSRRDPPVRPTGPCTPGERQR
jgi:uncharacterized protein